MEKNEAAAVVLLTAWEFAQNVVKIASDTIKEINKSGGVKAESRFFVGMAIESRFLSV